MDTADLARHARLLSGFVSHSHIRKKGSRGLGTRYEKDRTWNGIRRRGVVVVVQQTDTATSAPAAPAPSPEHVESAQAAGLRYVTDRSPGIRRKRFGKGFVYFD